MIRLLLDANVLFSAAHRPDSAQGLLIDLAEAVAVGATTSAYALEETRRNLLIKSPASTNAWTRIFSVCSESPAPTSATLVWSSTRVVAKDAPILAAAIDSESDWLVTGDRRDFGHLFGTTQRGVLVLSPAEALRRLLAERTA